MTSNGELNQSPRWPSFKMQLGLLFQSCKYRIKLIIELDLMKWFIDNAANQYFDFAQRSCSFFRTQTVSLSMGKLFFFWNMLHVLYLYIH